MYKVLGGLAYEANYRKKRGQRTTDRAARLENLEFHWLKERSRIEDPISPPKTDLDGIAAGGVHLLALLLALSPSGYWCGIPHVLLVKFVGYNLLRCSVGRAIQPRERLMSCKLTAKVQQRGSR